MIVRIVGLGLLVVNASVSVAQDAQPPAPAGLGGAIPGPSASSPPQPNVPGVAQFPSSPQPSGLPSTGVPSPGVTYGLATSPASSGYAPSYPTPVAPFGTPSVDRSKSQEFYKLIAEMRKLRKLLNYLENLFGI